MRAAAGARWAPHLLPLQGAEQRGDQSGDQTERVSVEDISDTLREDHTSKESTREDGIREDGTVPSGEYKSAGGELLTTGNVLTERDSAESGAPQALSVAAEKAALEGGGCVGAIGTPAAELERRPERASPYDSDNDDSFDELSDDEAAAEASAAYATPACAALACAALACAALPEPSNETAAAADEPSPMLVKEVNDEACTGAEPSRAAAISSADNQSTETALADMVSSGDQAGDSADETDSAPPERTDAMAGAAEEEETRLVEEEDDTSRLVEEETAHLMKDSPLPVDAVEGDTLTAADAASDSDATAELPACALCQSGTRPFCGRMLPVAGSCVHVNCALWSSEVFEKELGVLHGVQSALRRGRKTLCASCGLPGASIGCSHRKCKANFHFACAIATNVCFVDDAQRATFCVEHRPPNAVPLSLKASRSLRVLGPTRMVKVLPAELAEAESRALVRVGALRVLQLGQPQPSRPQFHDRNQIFPLGYMAERRFHDLERPRELCSYVCAIQEGEGGWPLFCILHPRDDSLSTRAKSAGSAWHTLVGRLSRAQPGTKVPEKLTERYLALEGGIFFGFALPAIAQLIEQLPGTKECEGFRPRYSLAESAQRVPPLPTNSSGSARSEPYIRRSSQFKAERIMYHRPFINRGALQTRESQSSDDERHEGEMNLRRREGENKSIGQVERSFSALQMLHRSGNVEVRRSHIHNWGLFTMREHPKDAMVVEYKGEAIRSIMADAREKMYEQGACKGQGGDCYMFRLDAHVVLDATTQGNIARFMNHCCTPNCYSKVIESEKGKHIVIFAMRDLAANEEVVYDYKFPVEKAKIPCHCGSAKCLGVMN